jgi:release factor glutamine methyltransferase
VDKRGSSVNASGDDGNVAEPHSVRTLLAEARSAGVARLDAELLLATLTHSSRARILAFDEAIVDPATAAMYRAWLQRRAAGEPLAYITGVREFWSLPLSVAPGVLVPRPETELLVERCLALFDATPRRMAELGTGTLAIAAALARERPAWTLVATDRSHTALEVATLNRQRLQLPNIELRHGSWCEALGDERFDAILSNPPYVAPNDPALERLTFEPREALVAEQDGYADLFQIAAGAREHLNAGGMLLLEHGTTQAERLAAELVRLGYARVVCHRDLAGHDRVTEAQR